MRFFAAVIFSLAVLMLSGCETADSKKLPSRHTDDSDLPWGRPASWEGGLPGMGGIGTPTRY